MTYFFAPRNWHDLDLADLDLGGTSAIPVNVPVVARVLAMGKDGKAYVPNRENLGDQLPNCNDPGVDRCRPTRSKPRWRPTRGQTPPGSPSQTCGNLYGGCIQVVLMLSRREGQRAKGAPMDAAERGRSREERLFKALSGEMAELQSELGTAEQPRRLGLRLELQACEMLLVQLKRILAAAIEARPQTPEKSRRR